MTRTVSDEAKAVFEQLGLDRFQDLGIGVTLLNGVECDTIITVRPAGDGTDDVLVQPVAVLVNDAVFDMLEDPMADAKEPA